MKTTIEVNGYEIVIEETEAGVNVSAMKEGETIEEFQLELGEEGDEVEGSEDEIQDFEDFDSEEDSEEELDSADIEDEDSEEEFEEEDESEEDEVEEPMKLESFQSFLDKRNK